MKRLLRVKSGACEIICRFPRQTDRRCRACTARKIELELVPGNGASDPRRRRIAASQHRLRTERPRQETRELNGRMQSRNAMTALALIRPNGDRVAPVYRRQRAISACVMARRAARRWLGLPVSNSRNRSGARRHSALVSASPYRAARGPGNTGQPGQPDDNRPKTIRLNRDQMAPRARDITGGAYATSAWLPTLVANHMTRDANLMHKRKRHPAWAPPDGGAQTLTCHAESRQSAVPGDYVIMPTASR